MVYVILITWARGIYLPDIYLKATGPRLYIRKILSAHVITNIFHFGTLKICLKLTSIFWPLYIVLDTHCDCGARFYHCHDVLSW